MNNRRCLSYPSLKCVIRYMDPNWRFFHSARFPTLRIIFAIEPLVIENLTLEQCGFTVGPLHYSYSHVESFPKEGEVTVRMAVTRGVQGKYHAGDRYPDALMGDIVMPVVPTEKRVVKSELWDSNWKHPESFCFKISSVELQNVSRRMDGLKVHVTRKFYRSFFGGPTPIVRMMHINCHDGILRFPGNSLEFRVNGMKVGRNNEVCIGIHKMISPQFPLKCIIIEVDEPDDPVFQNEIFRNVEYLKINISGNSKKSWSSPLLTLRNRNIEIRGELLKADDFIRIAKDWMESPRPIGHKFSMRTSVVAEYLENLQIKLKFRKEGSGKTHPFTLTSKLKITGYRESRINGKPGETGNMWVMEVVETVL